MPQFRTKEELAHAKQAAKYQSVAEGKQYLTEGDSPFPIHGYFKNKLLGKQVKMIELNAGSALVENMVADTVTEMKISFGKEDDDQSSLEQQAMEWLEEIEYATKLEEAARCYYGVGDAVQQPFRQGDTITVANVDPSTWYPTLPTFTYQKVKEGRIICVWNEGQNGEQKWYALVENHSIGTVDYQLLQLESCDSLEGKQVPLGTIPRFKELKDASTELDYLAVWQISHQKSSTDLFGRSVLSPIWDILQEVSEIQTQIRQERIKHLRARIYAPSQSLQRAENVNADTQPWQLNSKQMARQNGHFFDMNQEVFPIPAGSTIVPGYITRDLQGIVIGSQEIDKLLSRAASIVGCPRSMFNLDETGDIHVETEKRKDRKYTRRVLHCQRKLAYMTKMALKTWLIWKKEGANIDTTVTFQSPFELSREETVGLMRQMNRDASFVSQREAVKEIFKDKKPEDQEALLEEIEEERTLSAPPNSLFNRIPAVEL